MTAHFFREQAVFLPSDDHLSRHAGTVVRPVGDVTGPRRPVRFALTRVREALHRRAVLRELNAMSDRELSDIGLGRDELHRVFEPGFEPSRHGA